MMSKKVYAKLLQARKNMSPYLQKISESKQYTYVPASQVVSTVRKELDAVGLLLIPRIKGHTVTEKTVENTDRDNRKKLTTTFFTELEMEYVWVDCESGEEVVVPFYSQGIDIASEKGVGKALTYAEKNFFIQQFNISTDNYDPDSFQNIVESSQVVNPISQDHVDVLTNLATKLAELRKVPFEAVISKFTQYDLSSLAENDYGDVKTRLEQWIENAESDLQGQQKVFNNNEPQSKKVETQNPQPTVQQQENNAVDDTNTFIPLVFRKLQYETTPRGENVARIAFVDENGTSTVVMAREKMLNEVKKLEGKEEQQVQVSIEELNGFKFLLAVQ